MEPIEIKICLTDSASEVLHAYGITPETYGPAYGGESVGLDLYNCGDDITIPSLKKWHVFEIPVVLVPTGVKIIVPPGWVALLKERSSVIQTPLTIRAGVIDPGYTGEIFVNFINMGDKDVNVPRGVKLPAQLLVVPCQSNYTVVSNLDFLEETKDSVRKMGSVGSSESNAALQSTPSPNNSSRDGENT